MYEPITIVKPSSDSIDRSTSLRFYLQPFQNWLEQSDITEICVNRPWEIFVERESKWEQYTVPILTLDYLKSLATAAAVYIDSEINDSRPFLSARLPDGERIQIVYPPACETGTISVTIRKPSQVRFNLAAYENQNFFAHIQPSSDALTPDEQDLLELKDRKDYAAFLRRAVQLEKVIVVAGETGSGKTTFMKALVQAIPTDHRIITIEDVHELFLPDHPNHVHLFYPSEGDNNAFSTPATCLKSCLRMKPTRILLAELRGAETFDFINICSSGHGGSITSCHAGSVELTFERMALMVLQNEQGRTLPHEVIRHLLYMTIDVVVHIHNDIYSNHGRHITEIWYDPARKRRR